MSAQVGQGFLPLFTSWAERQPFLDNVLTTLLPNYVKELCPLPVIVLQGERQLRWPTVAVACVCGYVLGLLSGGHMLRRAMTSSRREKGFFFLGFHVSLVRRHVPGWPLPPLHKSLALLL